MESNSNWPKQTGLEEAVSMPTKFRSNESEKIETARNFNWPICFLCIVSLTISGVLAYREYLLESRIATLESRCLLQVESSPDLVVQRLRRELQEQFDAHPPAHPESAAIFRMKRDVECNCPPGMYIQLHMVYVNRSVLKMFNLFGYPVRSFQLNWIKLHSNITDFELFWIPKQSRSHTPGKKNR